MERPLSLDDRAWRRSAAAGFVALAVSVGGAVATSTEASSSCRASRVKSGSEWVVDHLAPHVTPPPLVSKIARAAVAYMLGTCA